MHSMKNKFYRLFSNKTKFKKVFFSVVALLIALVFSISTVNAWVETISTIRITGEGNIDTFINTSAKIDTTSPDSIDLTTYFRKAGNVHLSEASSADGNNFYFPVVDSTSTNGTKYRKGTSSDENVNYIKFSVKVTSTNNLDYMLSKVPTIKVGDTKLSDSSVRIAVTDESTNKTMIMSQEASSDAVVANRSGETAETSVNAYSHYVTNSLFTINKDETKVITIKMWLQTGVRAASDISGKRIEVTDFIIEPSTPKFEVKAVAVTDDVESGVGGTVQVGSSSAGAISTEAVSEGGSVVLKAVANEGYKFVGWSEQPTGTITVYNDSVTLQNITVAKTLYAQFKTAYTITAVAVTDGQNESDLGGTVVVGSNTSPGKKSVDLIVVGEKVAFVATNNDKYAFTGWYDSNGNLISADPEYSISEVTSSVTYYAKFVTAYKVIAHAVTNGNIDSSTGGTVTIGTLTSGNVVEDDLAKGSTVTFKAEPNESAGYEFEGWYTDPDDDNTYITNSTTYTVNNLNANTEVYARFKQTSRTIYFKPNSAFAADEAIFACYVWTGTDNKWYPMASVGNGVYAAAVDPKYTGILFSRFHKDTTDFNFNTQWNQTPDFNIPTDGKNTLTLTGSFDSGFKGTWS